jgi:phosphate transport system substrate-binding protein
MKTKKKAVSRYAVAALVVVVGAIVVGVAISMSRSSNTSNTTPFTTIDLSKIQASVVAGGSTFINPQMQVWVQNFEAKYPNILVTYNSVGSGAGVSNFIKGVYDIGATDVPMPSNLWTNATKAKGAVITVPDIVGGVALIYNIPGFNQSEVLNLTPEILAGVYLGKTAYWDDPTIQSANPGFKFPHQQIIVVHRSDGSGTTFVFTRWLSLSSQTWANSGVGYGYTISWPVDSTQRGLGGKGSPGVTAYVKQNAYSIGYVEVQYALANSLPTAAVLNPSTGQYVRPTTNAVSIAVSSVNLQNLPNATADWSRVTSVLLNVKASGAYPITTFSYLVFARDYTDLNKAAAIYAFLYYVFTTGQSSVIQGYLALPQNVEQYVLSEIQQITCNGKAVYKLVA